MAHRGRAFLRAGLTDDDRGTGFGPEQPAPEVAHRSRPPVRAAAGGRERPVALDRWGRCRGTIWVVTAPVHDVLADSRTALRIGDAAGARRLLEGAGVDRTSGAVLESLAQASYLQFDFLRCVEEWESAYAAHRSSGDHVGAVRVARTVACVP